MNSYNHIIYIEIRNEGNNLWYPTILRLDWSYRIYICLKDKFGFCNRSCTISPYFFLITWKLDGVPVVYLLQMYLRCWQSLDLTWAPQKEHLAWKHSKARIYPRKVYFHVERFPTHDVDTWVPFYRIKIYRQNFKLRKPTNNEIMECILSLSPILHGLCTSELATGSGLTLHILSVLPFRRKMTSKPTIWRHTTAWIDSYRLFRARQEKNCRKKFIMERSRLVGYDELKNRSHCWPTESWLNVLARQLFVVSFMNYSTEFVHVNLSNKLRLLYPWNETIFGRFV